MNSEFYEKYNDRTVTILGTEWTIKVVPADDKRLNDIDATGICESYAKEIYVKDRTTEDDPKQYLNIEDFVKKVIRHELIHAFFYESAHLDYYDDETLTDTLALIIPKMAKAMQELELM